MEITYIGHSSFKIKSRATTLVTDPFDPSFVGVKFPKLSADIVTVSHDHNDHNKVDLVNPPAGGVKKIVNGPGEYEIAGISIIGIPTFHDDNKGKDRGKNTVYVIEIEDYKLVHLGDLGHTLGESDLEALGDVDILMVPVGGVYTIGSSTAVELVRAIEPNIVLPMHYKHPSLNQDSFGTLEDLEQFLSAVSMPVETTTKLVLKGIIPEEQKVVKLTPLYA